MKKYIKYITASILALAVLASCSDYLETEPTNQFSGPTIFADADAANTAIHGIYAVLWRYAFVSGNSTQAFGHQADLLAEDLMADDMVQMAFNWWGWDYDLSYTSRANNGGSTRNYSIWNRHYRIVSNANYILANEGEIAGDQALATNVMAQAYAMRAFAYFELIQGLQKTYIGNEQAKGVPIYTEPTTAESEGKPRGTVEDVYTQINADINKSLELFATIDKPVQEHSSVVDYYVVKGFQARVALLQGNNQLAFDAAKEARSRSGVRLLNKEEIMKGFSDSALPSTLWAMEMINDQSHIWGSIYCALDPHISNAYGAQQRKCISSWLYNRIATPDFEDSRTKWFKDGKQGSATSGINVNYGQMKRLPKTLDNWVGDLIFMRAEEMLLIQAEAKAKLGQYAETRSLLKELAVLRMTDTGFEAYSNYIDKLPNANTLSASAIADTNTDPQNIFEEVIMQRRIELWGELGRIKDVLRLKQGYNRTYAGSNHVEKLLTINTGPESGAFLFKIPQAEFDGNRSMDPNDDQNPTN